MTNWDYHESQERFQRIMSALGVSRKLKDAGAISGDTIQIGSVDFKYYEENAMAIRARLAGFVDEEEESDEMSAAGRRALDEELASMLDGEGEVTIY